MIVAPYSKRDSLRTSTTMPFVGGNPERNPEAGGIGTSGDRDNGYSAGGQLRDGNGGRPASIQPCQIRIASGWPTIRKLHQIATVEANRARFRLPDVHRP